MPHDVCPNCGAGLPFKEADLCWKCGFRLKPLPEGAEQSDKWAITFAVGLFVAPILISAILAAIVFGMAGGVERTRVVAATAKQSGEDIFVTWQGGRDNDLVSSYDVVTNGARYARNLPPVVGEITKVGPGTTGADHVVVTATFSDGSQQVVLDTYV
jgi:archaeal type IV pilus assembly protein PilA